MVHVSEEVFDELLRQAMDELPDPFAQVLERIPVIVDPLPGPELFASVERAEELLGLYSGPPCAEWDATDVAPETAVIYLFQRALEASCASRAELGRQVAITLRHELGHALGFDERGLRRIGLD